MRLSIFIAAFLFSVAACAGTEKDGEHKAAEHKAAVKTVKNPHSFDTKKHSPALGSYVEGKHYSIIKGAKKPVYNGSVKVVEVFWYGCGHCFNFEKVIEPWVKTKPDYINFTRSPAMWRQRRGPADIMWTHAKLYYAASALNLVDKLHHVFFDAMHVNKKTLGNKSEIKQVVDAEGLDGANFIKVMDSFAVNSQVQLADTRQRDYGVTGTPEVVVGDYYHVSSQKAGSQAEMLKIASFLANKIRHNK